MNFRSAFTTVFRKELRELVRDKRALLFLLAPPFVLPAIGICAAIFIGAQAVSLVTQGFPVAVVNPEAAPALVMELELNQSIVLVDPPAEGADWGEVLVVLTLPDDFMERAENNETAYVTLTTRDATWGTTLAASAVRNAVGNYSDTLLKDRLLTQGLDWDWLAPVVVSQERAPVEGVAQPVGISTEDGGGGGDTSLGALFLPLAVTSWLVGGGLGLIIDSTVGEKERRTMEALLLTPASRLGIVAGKLAVVFIASIVVMSIWLIEGIILSVLGSAGPALLSGDSGISTGELLIQSAGQVLTLAFFLIWLALPFIVTLNSLMMAWCTFASSYKESNLVLFLLQLALPMMVFIAVFSLPGDVGLGWYLTPIMGTVIAIRDLFSGVLTPIDLVVSTIAGVWWSALALMLAAYIYSREWALVRGIS